MAESSDSSTLFWVDPKERGVFPLDGLIVSNSLAKTLRADRFEVRADAQLRCGRRRLRGPRKDLDQRGNSPPLPRALRRRARPFDRGLAKAARWSAASTACRSARLFSARACSIVARDASKVALAHLVARLRLGGYRLLDTQFVTPHLASLGAIEVSRGAYLQMLGRALSIEADFSAWPIAQADGRQGGAGPSRRDDRRAGGPRARRRYGSC